MEDDDVNTRILVNMIFNKSAQQKTMDGNISIPNCILGKDFSQKIRSVMFIKSQIIACRWRKYFDTCCKMMLLTHELFLRFVLFACASEDECHQNIFERFLSACALVEFLCDETLQKTGVNFCHLNSDIIMTFYRYHLKIIFVRRGGFQRLVEYICGHRYLSLKLIKDISASPKTVKDDLDEKIQKELKRDRVTEKKTNSHLVMRDEYSRILAKEVVSVTLDKLPTLPDYHSYQNNLRNVNPSMKKEIAKVKLTETTDKSEDLNTASNECSSSNSESKTNHDVKHQEETEWYDTIVQAAIRHNQSKSSNKAKVMAINRMHDKTDGALVHLKDKIKSLIEVLTECDNE